MSIKQNPEWVNSITEEVAIFGLTVRDAMMMRTNDNLDVPISGDVLTKMGAK